MKNIPKRPWVDRESTTPPPGATEAPIEFYSSNNPAVLATLFAQLLRDGKPVAMIYPADEMTTVEGYGTGSDVMGIHLHGIDPEDFRDLIHNLDIVLQHSIAMPMPPEETN